MKVLDGLGVWMGYVAGSISVVLHERLPWQRKTQRENLALLVATMLSLMSLAAALPRQPDRIDMRYQWIVRVLAKVECGMLAFAREVLARAQAEAGPGERVDDVRAGRPSGISMLALRWGDAAGADAMRESCSTPMVLPGRGSQ